MKVAFVLAALVACAMAQQFRCKMPQQWEARQIRFDPNHRVYHNHSSDYRTYGRYAYDGINFRKFHFEEASFGDAPDKLFEIVELFREGKAYVTDVRSRECRLFNIPTTAFRPHDIPATAEFIGYEYLGSYPNQFELSQWHSTQFVDGQNFTTYQTFSESQCAPVRDDHFSEQTGFHYEEFSDITLGFHDPNIWIPPSGCTPGN